MDINLVRLINQYVSGMMVSFYHLCGKSKDYILLLVTVRFIRALRMNQDNLKVKTSLIRGYG